MTDPPRGLRRWRSGIRARVVVWYLVLFGLSSMVALVSIRQILLVQFDDEVEQALAQEVEEFRLNAESTDAATSARELFGSFLGQNVPDEQEVYVALIGGELVGAAPAGRADPVTSTALIAEWAAITEPTFGRSSAADGPRRWLAVPVVREGEIRGTFVVTYATDDEEAAIARALWVMAGVTAAVLLLASILAWATAGRVLAPLRDLTRTARQISQDNLADRIPVEGDDEVAELTRTLNDTFDRLDAAFTQQREFLNDASHELRTPITIVRGHLELLPTDPAERKDVIEVCLDELDRMGRHVSDLLTLAKAERPDFLHLREVDIAEFTDGLEALARGIEPDRRWRIERLAPVVVAADPDRLTQAMVNLMANAAQHTDAGDEILVGSDDRDGVIRLWVTDRGAGIDPVDQQRVFQRFARGGRSAERRSEGSGLGLAIVSAVAAAHRGHIELTSAVGEGSTFTLALPAGGPEDIQGRPAAAATTEESSI